MKKNRIYRWEEGGGLFTIGKSVYLEPSGCRSNETLCKSLVEPGKCVLCVMCVAVGFVGVIGVWGSGHVSRLMIYHVCVTLTRPPPAGANGLTTEPGSGLLVMCEHGERRVSRYILMPLRWPFVCYAILPHRFIIMV